MTSVAQHTGSKADETLDNVAYHSKTNVKLKFLRINRHSYVGEVTFKAHVLPESKISHLFIEEAENERMHLMTALEMKKPGIIFRGTILLAQGNFIS